MNVFIFVSNINTPKDLLQIKKRLDRHKKILNWSVDLTDEEKVLRIVTDSMERIEVIGLIRSCGYDCHKMDW